MIERLHLARPAAPTVWAIVAFVTAIAVWAVWSPGHFPTSDAHAYDSSARHLLATGQLEETWAPHYKAWRPHGYTLFVAAVYGATGSAASHVIAAQTVMFALMVWMLVLACRIAARSAAAQHLCGLLLLTYVPFYRYVQSLLAEQLHFFLLAGVILAVAALERMLRLREERTRALALAGGAGAVFGLAVLAKGFAFYFPLVAFTVALLWAAVRRACGLRISWQPAIVGLLAFVVSVGPYLARNWVAIGTPTTLTTYGGYNLYIANYALQVGDWKDPTNSRYYPEINAQVNDVRRRYPSEAKQDSVLTDRAFAIIRANKSLFLKKALWQARMTLTTAGRYGLGGAARASETQYVLLLILGALGAVLWFSRAPLLVTGIVAYSAYVVAIFAITFTMNRLKEPLMPGVILLAALALSEALRLRPRHSRQSARR